MSLLSTFKTSDVKKAIELIGAECLGALQVCNALSGTTSPEWRIVHGEKWSVIVEEGKKRGLNFSSMKCAVTDTPLLWSGNIQCALGLITDSERKLMFCKHVKVNGKWPEPTVI